MKAHAKLNLALVVGPLRSDGKHEVATVFQRLELADDVTLEPADELAVHGFPHDTLVHDALTHLAAAAGVPPHWHVRIDKQIPIAAGLGGGSSDAAAALRLANEALPEPLPHTELHALAAELGADVPFFLHDGPQLGTGDGTHLAPLDLAQDYAVLLLLPHGEEKASTGEVYRAFDGRHGSVGWEERHARLNAALEARDLGLLPRNDLARSPLADELHGLGAFRADVSGAGPTLYGLFVDEDAAAAAVTALDSLGRIWITKPAW